MAISRVPGYSLLANLDRQGTDISLTSSGLTLQYWDVINYRVGINNSAPQQTLDVSGNILTSNGHVYTNANISFNIGNQYNWWRTVYAESIQSVNVVGTLLTNAQPNITSIGTLANLSVTGNLSVDGNLTVDGNLIVNGVTVGNLSANTITANVFGNITGYVLQGDQPFITNLGDITVSNITITGGNLVIGGNVNFDEVYAGNLYQSGNRALDTSSNLQINGDVIGYGNVANIYVQLNTTGVSAGVYGDDGIFSQLSVDSKGRIISAANISLSKIANLNFIDTTISSNTDITISTTSNGNIILDAQGSGIVQIVGTDAFGLPVGDDSQRPASAEEGYLRYNQERSSIEFFDGYVWNVPGDSSITSQIITPDGVANTFVLSANTTTAGTMVSINGVLQRPYQTYNVSGTSLVFVETPLVTDIIEIRTINTGAVIEISSLVKGAVSVSLDNTNVNVQGELVLSNPLAIAYGGTGANTANTALQNLLPVSSNYGYVLTTDGSGGYFFAEGTPGPAGTFDTTYETLSQNVSAYPYTINRTGSTITSVVYTVGGNTIIKSFTYNGSGQIESIAIYGVPLGATVYTKNLTYSGTSVSGVSYSIL